MRSANSCRVKDWYGQKSIARLAKTLRRARGAELPRVPSTERKGTSALWATFDSTKEPLETQVLDEYESNGVTIKMISYCHQYFQS